MKKIYILLPMTLLAGASMVMAQDFSLTPAGYFNNAGVDVMAFSDFYPEGHQGGVSLIMNGRRMATNGDIRLEPTPGQWQPVPKQLSREVTGQHISTTLCYPDSSRHLTGFNPMIYPDVNFTYTVDVTAEDDGILVTVNLDRPIPQEFAGKIGFNLELFPGYLFGKPWIMDSQSGIFAQQPNSPLLESTPNLTHTGNFHQEGKPLADIDRLVGDGLYSPIVADNIVSAPYAVGRKFTCCPDDPYSRFTVESYNSDLELYDGRMNHNNGWFVLHSPIAEGVTEGAVRWKITPNVVGDWTYPAVVQTSQVGYHTQQPKVAIIETDRRVSPEQKAQLIRIDADGEHIAKDIDIECWGDFLRYNYLKADFSDITSSGLYKVRYGEQESPVFRISDDIYDRGVWQPVIEYFLPVQMCHMRVNEKYRVWHDRCHMDDATMAPAGNHIDGYVQVEGLSRFSPEDKVEGVNVGGWHDAGDFDLRIESQAGETYILSLAYECFQPDIDVTCIDQDKKVTEIHQPDGKNDILQQIEHGALSVVAAYDALGRLYRGIICRDLRQYAMLGDAAAMTDGIPGNGDDRWIFTEDNPMREIQAAAALAATARALAQYNDTLSVRCRDIAVEIYDKYSSEPQMQGFLVQPAVELYFTTGDGKYLDLILDNRDAITSHVGFSGWYLSRLAKAIEDSDDPRAQDFNKKFTEALRGYALTLAQQAAETPYGVPYRPNIWGAGWDIQGFGYRYYFLADNYPEIFPKETVYNALNFVLGCHPGSNAASFASGVGAKSATVAYGLNRADWSYIPGGVVSGTALIRPDFPELMEFPFLWQQVEYVLGGGSSHYMFLVLAAQHLLK